MNRQAALKRVIDGLDKARFLHPQAARGIPLWIHIHQQHAALEISQTRRQIDGRGGLTDAAFLIHDCNSAAHSPLPRNAAT